MLLAVLQLTIHMPDTFRLLSQNCAGTQPSVPLFPCQKQHMSPQVPLAALVSTLSVASKHGSAPCATHPTAPHCPPSLAHVPCSFARQVAAGGYHTLAVCRHDVAREVAGPGNGKEKTGKDKKEKTNDWFKPKPASPTAGDMLDTPRGNSSTAPSNPGARACQEGGGARRRRGLARPQPAWRGAACVLLRTPLIDRDFSLPSASLWHRLRCLSVFRPRCVVAARGPPALRAKVIAMSPAAPAPRRPAALAAPSWHHLRCLSVPRRRAGAGTPQQRRQLVHGVAARRRQAGRRRRARAHGDRRQERKCGPREAPHGRGRRCRRHPRRRGRKGPGAWAATHHRSRDERRQSLRCVCVSAGAAGARPLAHAGRGGIYV
jgi:hypothetical protein